MRNLVVKLAPQGIAAGRVFDDEGEPLQGVFVQLLRKRYVRDMARWLPSGSAQTNAGNYLLVARYVRTGGGAVESPEGGTLGYAPAYYPGVTASSQAGLISVAAGRETGGLDVRLQKSRLFRISGQVVDGAGNPRRTRCYAERMGSSTWRTWLRAPTLWPPTA